MAGPSGVPSVIVRFSPLDLEKIAEAAIASGVIYEVRQYKAV
jgi:hypothetical protein